MDAGCPQCGAKIDDGASRCRLCGSALGGGGGGWWRRLLRALGGGSAGERTQPTRPPAALSRTTRREEYHTLEEMPPELRAKLAPLLEAGLQGDYSMEMVNGRAVYVFRDSDGQTHRYTSLDEMPPQVRLVFDRMQPDGR